MPIGNNVSAGASGQGASSFHIEQSLRFTSGSCLFRTWNTGAITDFTISCWFKCAWHFNETATQRAIVGADNIHVHIEDDVLHFRSGTSNAGTVGDWRAGRDKTGWQHLVVHQENGAKNATCYINGTEVTNAGASNWQMDNFIIGARNTGAASGFMGYIAEVMFIDGQRLAPTEFAEPNEQGVWVPKDVGGTLNFGTNGGWYRFEDRTNPGNDSSSNNNDLTTQGTFNNSDTTGMINDVLCLDTPTNNFCIINSNHPSDRVTTSSAKAQLETTNHDGVDVGTHPITSGKWYWEVQNHNDNVAASAGIFNGTIIRDNGGASTPGSGSMGATTFASRGEFFDHTSGGNKRKNSTATSYGSAWNSGSPVLMIAFDADARKIWFGSNGSWFASGDPANGTNEAWGPSDISNLSTDDAGYWVPFIHGASTTALRVNFGQLYVHNGQRETDPNASTGAYSFRFEPPAGFKALCSKNFPEVAIPNPKEHFEAKKYTANNGTAQTVTLQFEPDLILFRGQPTGSSWWWWDCTRGETKYTQNDGHNAETTDSTLITNRSATGFTLGADSSSRKINSGTGTVAAMCWKMGGTPTQTNTVQPSGGGGQAMTDGSVFKDGVEQTSFVPTGAPSRYPNKMSINSVAKMSVVQWTGIASGDYTLPHGLGVRPAMIIYQNHTNADAVVVWNHECGATSHYQLSARHGASSGANIHNNNTTDCDEHHFSVGNNGNNDQVSNRENSIHTAYVFANLDGFQEHGRYRGKDYGGSHGFVNGRFIYTGFKPAALFTKSISASGSSDPMFLTSVFGDGHNFVAGGVPFLNTDAAGGSAAFSMNFHANGLKITNSSTDFQDNSDSSEWMFSVWGEQPYVGSNVAPATGYGGN